MATKKIIKNRKEVKKVEVVKKEKKVEVKNSRPKFTGEAQIEVRNATKDFIVGSQTINVLKGISLKIKAGDFAIIFGPSGCGKSTLLHAILGMEAPTTGEVLLDGQSLYEMSEDDMVRFRKARIGVVFQQSIWIKSLNVIENVSLPNRLKGMDVDEAETLAMETLKKVKLEDWAHHHPSELSSGQQQRISLARALTIDPLVIVADEPTGNLDTVSSDELMDLLLDLSQNQGKTVLMVTHDLEYLKYASKLFHIIDGLLVEEFDSKGAEKLSKAMKSKKGARSNLTVADGDFLKNNNDTYAIK